MNAGFASTINKRLDLSNKRSYVLDAIWGVRIMINKFLRGNFNEQTNKWR